MPPVSSAMSAAQATMPLAWLRSHQAMYAEREAAMSAEREAMIQSQQAQINELLGVQRSLVAVIESELKSLPIAIPAPPPSPPTQLDGLAVLSLQPSPTSTLGGADCAMPSGTPLAAARADASDSCSSSTSESPPYPNRSKGKGKKRVEFEPPRPVTEPYEDENGASASVPFDEWQAGFFERAQLELGSSRAADPQPDPKTEYFYEGNERFGNPTDERSAASEQLWTQGWGVEMLRLPDELMLEAGATRPVRMLIRCLDMSQSVIRVEIQALGSMPHGWLGPSLVIPGVVTAKRANNYEITIYIINQGTVPLCIGEGMVVGVASMELLKPAETPSRYQLSTLDDVTTWQQACEVLRIEESLHFGPEDVIIVSIPVRLFGWCSLNSTKKVQFHRYLGPTAQYANGSQHPIEQPLSAQVRFPDGEPHYVDVVVGLTGQAYVEVRLCKSGTTALEVPAHTALGCILPESESDKLRMRPLCNNRHQFEGEHCDGRVETAGVAPKDIGTEPCTEAVRRHLRQQSVDWRSQATGRMPVLSTTEVVLPPQHRMRIYVSVAGLGCGTASLSLHDAPAGAESPIVSLQSTTDSRSLCLISTELPQPSTTGAVWHGYIVVVNNGTFPIFLEKGERICYAYLDEPWHRELLLAMAGRLRIQQQSKDTFLSEWCMFGEAYTAQLRLILNYKAGTPFGRVSTRQLDESLWFILRDVVQTNLHELARLAEALCREAPEPDLLCLLRVMAIALHGAGGRQTVIDDLSPQPQRKQVGHYAQPGAGSGSFSIPEFIYDDETPPTPPASPPVNTRGGRTPTPPASPPVNIRGGRTTPPRTSQQVFAHVEARVAPLLRRVPTTAGQPPSPPCSRMGGPPTRRRHPTAR